MLFRSGSAALDLAWVAAGRFDGYWESDLKPWDVAAGMLLVKEAGGFVTDYRGGDKVIERDKHRWELDPASSEDYKGRTGRK